MPTITYPAQTVVVTGASSGIGEAFARELAARGAHLVLVARRLDRLQALAAELEASSGVSVAAISIDLSSLTAAAELRAALSSRGLRPTALINNAGFGTFGMFADDTPEHLAREIAVDVSAPVMLTLELLPGILSAPQGFVINVASMAGHAPAPRMAVYGAAKAFVLSFTDALWAELRATPTTAFSVSPGATSTEFNAVVGTDDATAGARPRSAEDVVVTALTHLERRNPGPRVIDGVGNRIAAAMMRFISTRAAATSMLRLTDPARRRSAAASA